ncbi:MAG: endonuclease domain-containing protein [Synergistaceae bacterium]|nr:endonuclease domain-containing protein [Synergistaceae bacterium]
MRYDKKIIPLARELRRNMTPEERRLWYDFLAKYPVRFQRQKVIDRYIADFYCFEAALVVELDGGQHFCGDRPDYDRRRTESFMKLGIEVIRFTNHELQRSFNDVCREIDRHVVRKLTREVPEPPGFLRELDDD